MSLGSDQISQAVEQKLEEAVHDGIACIVAAGNSGGPVQYPASSPNVLAVSAVGKLKEYPSESWDARTVTQAVTQDGLFSPSFTCFGPQIGVCAPGVSIVSSVPDNGFEPQSGTSMAAPHVTGFAALLLAHHPAFQGAGGTRGPQRVAALFNLIKTSCRPYQLGPERTGCGVPSFQALANVLAKSANGGRTAAATQGQSGTTAGTPAATAHGTNGDSATSTTPAPAPQPGLPPNIDPQLWQTVILPQLVSFLASQGALPLLAEFAQVGWNGPNGAILAGLVSQLVAQAQNAGLAPFQAAPTLPGSAAGNPYDASRGSSGGSSSFSFQRTVRQ
jgi:subtilisin family serine protease